MDLNTASAFILVISENFSHYSAATQRNLLEGIFQLADECKENLTERPDAPFYEDIAAKLSLAKLFASDALKSGNFCEGFRLVAECFWPSAAVPEEFP